MIITAGMWFTLILVADTVRICAKTVLCGDDFESRAKAAISLVIWAAGFASILAGLLR